MTRCKVFVALFLLILSNNLWAQKKIHFSFSKSSVGFILADGKPVGTGFVAGKSNWVITCEHVDRLSPGPKEFQQISTNQKIPIKLLHKSSKFDIAIFEANRILSDTFFNLDTTHIVKLNSMIIYAGYDKSRSHGDTSMLFIQRATIEAAGALEVDNLSTKFIEFVGEGQPGYSGGPVFNDKGDIIAIMAQAYLRKGLKKNSKQELINRAFVIQPIVELLKE